MIRLRQVVLVAADRDAVLSPLCEMLDVTPWRDDPIAHQFGLHNAVVAVGDQFIEVVSPTAPGTAAGRQLDRRGDGGYMIVFEVDDLDARLAVARRLGVRVVWEVDLPEIRGRHLHPSDVGGAIVSLDEPTPSGGWRWGGPLVPHAETSVATAVAGVHVAAASPAEVQLRWAELDIDHSVRFVSAGARGTGVDVIDLVSTDRSKVGRSVKLGGVEFRFV